MPQRFDCMIVDDDEIDRLTTLSFVNRYAFLQVTGVYDNATEALAAARKTPPQVMFLDIDIPGMSGLEMRERLLDIPACIFISAYPDYALESFEKEALDFLVKPLKADRFARAMDRLRQYLDIREKAGLLDLSLGGDTLFIKEGHDQVKISLHQVIYLEALKDYTSIVTTRRKYCVLSPLGNLLKQAAFQQFIRIHRSFAVQRHYIGRIAAGQVFVNEIPLPVGRSYRDSLQALINPLSS